MQDNNALVHCKFSFSALQILIQCTANSNVTDAVQVVGEAGKAFPTELSSVLQIAHPSLLMITPAALSPKLRKAGVTSTILPVQFAGVPWQVIQTAQSGTMQISSSISGWNVSPSA